MNVYINLIKIAIKHNKKGFIINKNKKNLNFNKIFINIGIIKFTIIKNTKIIVYINYINNKPLFKNIINFWKKSNLKTITYINLKKINLKYNWILILSTNKGILSINEAIKNKTGGILLAKIWN